MAHSEFFQATAIGLKFFMLQISRKLDSLFLDEGSWNRPILVLIIYTHCRIALSTSPSLCVLNFLSSKIIIFENFCTFWNWFPILYDCGYWHAEIRKFVSISFVRAPLSTSFKVFSLLDTLKIFRLNIFTVLTWRNKCNLTVMFCVLIRSTKWM